MLAPPSTNSQDISVSVNETLKSDTINGTDEVSKRSSSEESLVLADDQLVENSLDSDQSSIVLPETNFLDTDVSVSETLKSSSNETEKGLIHLISRKLLSLQIIQLPKTIWILIRLHSITSEKNPKTLV